MSVWKHLFDNEFAQRRDIESLREAAAKRSRRLKGASRKAEGRLLEMEEEIGELTLLCRSLLTYLRERGDLDMEQFAEVMSRVDAEDGVADGKVTRPAPAQPDPTPPVIRRRKRR